MIPLDRWTIAYLAFVSLAFLVRWPAGRPFPATLLVAHAGLAGLTLLAPRLRLRRGLRFLGDFYPLLAVFWLYLEVGFLNSVVGVAHDGTVQRWEEAVFGLQASLAWIRACPWPWLSALLHLGYLSHYLLLPAGSLALWFSGRREAAREALSLVMLTFYLCYGFFLVFPVAGPRYAFPPPDNAASAVGIAAFTNRLVAEGSAWGTAFPSSHVAAGLVAALSTWIHWRRLGACLLPFAVLLSLGTVYGQFHYAVDALAGAALGLAVIAGYRLTRRTAR